jgi:hypothetical protein
MFRWQPARIRFVVRLAIGLSFLVSGLLPLSALAQALPPRELPTVLCYFDCADFSYSNHERASRFAELTQALLGELPDTTWVDRGQLRAALQELELSAWNPSSPATALQLGKIVSAEFAIVGRFAFEKTNGALPWNLHVEILDLTSADVLASESLQFAAEELKQPRQVLPHNHPDFREGVEPLPIRERDAKATADAIRRQFQFALKADEERRKLIHVAVLQFRNQAPATRLDYLERDLCAGFSRLNQPSPTQSQPLHVLQFPRAANAIEEAQLLADGLSQRMDGESRRADYFVWGEFRETSESETPFPDVVVELNVYLWDGVKEPKSFRAPAKTRDLSGLIDRAVNFVGKQAVQRASGDLETRTRQQLADQLLGRAREISKANFRNPSPTQIARNQNQILKLLSTAALFDVNNAAVRSELNLQANYYVEFPATNREAFARKFKEYSDWKRYAEKFGNTVNFDESYLPDSRLAASERHVALQSSLVGMLMHATGSRFSPSLLRVPSDVPKEVVEPWHRHFVAGFAQALQAEMELESEFRGRHLSWGRLLDVIAYVDPPKLRGELIVRLMKNLPETNNLHLLSEPQGKPMSETSRRIIEAFEAINEPHRADELREVIRRGNPNWGREAAPYVSPYQLKKLAEQEATKRGEVKPPPQPKKPTVPELRIVELPIKPIVLPAQLSADDDLPPDRVQAVLFAGGYLWIAVSNSTQHGQVFRVAVEEDPPTFTELPRRLEQSGRMFDLGEQFWVANFGVGIESFRYSKQESGRTVLHFQKQITSRDGLPTEFIRAMVRDGEQIYCGGGFNNIGSLGRYDLKTETWSKIDLPPWRWGDREVQADEIHLLAAGAEKVAIYCNLSNRLLVRDRAGGEWTNVAEIILLKHPKLAFAQKARFEVRGIQIIDNALWIASRKGMVAVDLSLYEVRTVVPTKFEITTMCVHGKYLWIGGSGSRLLRLDRRSGAFDLRVNIPRKHWGAPISITTSGDRLWYGVDQGAAGVDQGAANLMEVDLTDLD